MFSMESSTLSPPSCLYGAESWILYNGLLAKLESFQAELAKRILCLHKNTANNIACMALQWPSVRARILIIKLKFLHKIVVGDLDLSVQTFRSLTGTVSYCCWSDNADSSNLHSTLPSPLPYSHPPKVSLFHQSRRTYCKSTYLYFCLMPPHIPLRLWSNKLPPVRRETGQSYGFWP